MQNKWQLQKDIEAIQTLKILVQEYEEISMMRVQKVRDSVFKGRFFLEGLDYIFKDVKLGYRKQLQKLLEKNKKVGHDVLTTLNKNGKSVSVVLSANTSLYGQIVHQVFGMFLEHIQKHEDTDIVIVGKIGKRLYERSGQKRGYSYFEIPDISAKMEHLRQLLSKIADYQKVDVFYGKFYNVMNQFPAATNVSGQQIFAVEEDSREKYQIVFEPNVENIFQFFEMQVFNNMFYQTAHEAELARHGSRISEMERSLGNVNKEERLLMDKKSRLKKLIENKKRLEGLAGISLWR